MPPIKTPSSHVTAHNFIARLMRSGYGVLQHATVEDMEMSPEAVPERMHSLRRLHHTLTPQTMNQGVLNFGGIVVDVLVEDMGDMEPFPWGLDATDQVDHLALLVITPKDRNLWLPREFVALGTSERAFDVLAIMLAMAA